ncbi:hypothetical protein ACFQ0B_57305 [Nonomuraea thailandensis]
MSPLIGRLADRVGTRPLVLAGLAVMGVFALFLPPSRARRLGGPRGGVDLRAEPASSSS